MTSKMSTYTLGVKNEKSGVAHKIMFLSIFTSLDNFCIIKVLFA